MQEAKRMPKSHSALEREESDLRKRNSKPEGVLLITKRGQGAGSQQ